MIGLGDKFVKRLAAVKCEHDPMPPKHALSSMVHIVGVGHITCEENFKMKRARCIFCIARTTLRRRRSSSLKATK